MHIDEHNRKVLIITDMQIDFIYGVLKNPDAENIIDAVIAEIMAWDGIIIATRDTHHESNYADSIEGKSLPIHCVKGTPGWEIEPRIQKALEAKGAKFIDKPTFGFIGWPKAIFDIDSTDQEAVAALTANKGIVVRDAGTCTNICNTAALAGLRAWFPDARIELVDGACAASGLTKEERAKNQEAAFIIARSMLCEVVPTIYKG